MVDEQLNIKQRQVESIKLAKERGQHFGRPKVKAPTNFNKMYDSWKRIKITATKAMAQLGLKRTTFFISSLN